MTATASDCTCWHLPAGFGNPQPLGWLMVQDQVLIRLRTLTGQMDSFTGRILTALWGGPAQDRQRYLLMMGDEESPLREISEQQIVWADAAGRTDLCGLNETAARALAATVEAVSVMDAPNFLPGPATALIRLPGREFARVDVRRATHTCLPGDDIPSGRTSPPFTDSD